MIRVAMLIVISIFSLDSIAHNTVVTHPKITESGLELLIKSDIKKEYEELYQPLFKKDGLVFGVEEGEPSDIITTFLLENKTDAQRPIYQFWGFNPRVADEDSNKLIAKDNFGCFDPSRTDATASSNLYPCLSSPLLKPFLNRTVSEGVVFEDHPDLRVASHFYHA